MNAQNTSTKKRAYSKPALVHRQKIEALAAACDSAWVPSRVCMKEGTPTCQRTRF